MNGGPVDPRAIEIEDIKYDNEGNRVYVVNDLEGPASGEYVSVTSKLGETVPKGEGFYRWLANADGYEETQEYMKERGEIGTKVHDLCEKIANREVSLVGMEKELEDEIYKKAKGFQNFLGDKNIKVIDTEFVVFCKEFNYAGRCDLLVDIDGERVLIDLKTSKGVYDKHRLQLMLYRYGLEEGGVDIDKCAVLLLKNKDFEFVEVEYHPELVRAQNVFYEWLAGGDPSRFEIPVLEVEG
jgi:CRISPR/Cas system-associated exonuclease Cas4 (RecB family)